MAIALSLAFTVVASPHHEPKGQARPVLPGSPAGAVLQAALASCVPSLLPSGHPGLCEWLASYAARPWGRDS